MKFDFNRLILFFIVLLIVGCSAHSSVETHLAFKLKDYKTLSISVTPNLPVCEDECTEVIKNIEKLLVAKLDGSGVFSSVGVKMENSELKIHIKITELIVVTSKDRLLWGAFAGRAKVVGTVEVLDNKRNELLGRFTVEGVSSGGTVFAGTTKEAVEKFVEQVVNFIYEKLTI